MKVLLAALNEYYRSERPSFYSELQLGLSEGEIQSQEQRLGFALPDDVKLFYQWRNGQKPGSAQPFQFNFYWLPLDAAVSRTLQLNKRYNHEQVSKDWWNPQWLPLLDNGDGDHLCVDLLGIAEGESGQLINYWSDWEDRSVEYPDLKQFLGILLASMQLRHWKEDPEDGYQPTDEDQWEEFLESHLPGYPLDHEALATKVKFIENGDE